VKVEDAEELRFTGAVCAAAAAALTGVVSMGSLESAIQTEIGHLGAEAVGENLRRASDAYALMAGDPVTVKEGTVVSAEGYRPPGWIDFEFEEARLSAPAIHGSATSELMKTGLWRTVRPVVDYARCNRCWWLCSTFCPDGAISVNDEGFPEIDYDHCKGCMICMAQCPPHAISAEPEAEGKEGTDEA
jgi:pyruvate ferredoxin oxidoreductase gamma subunit